MTLSPGAGADRQVLELRGHRYDVRFWTTEEWGWIPVEDRPRGAIFFGFGWAHVTPVADGPPLRLFPRLGTAPPACEYSRLQSAN